MDVTPQLLREVEFREQWRGYNPDEVDDFLERLAVALEQLQERLREATQKASTAEQRAAEPTEMEEQLRRTLVLAQRTADATIAEAKDTAARLIDFASGLCYGLGGQMERVANQVYLLTPSNVEVPAEEKRRLQERGLIQA